MTTTASRPAGKPATAVGLQTLHDSSASATHLHSFGHGQTSTAAAAAAAAATTAAHAHTTRQTISGSSSPVLALHLLNNSSSNNSGTPINMTVMGKEAILSSTAAAGGGTPSSTAAVIHSSETHTTRTASMSRRDSFSVQSQLSVGVGGGGDWPPHYINNSSSADPDDQEQALFEQRLCEDIYGVAVRKINQNGKSNLRYVKCSYFDASELDATTSGSGGLQIGSSNHSSSRSVSSRASRTGFSRFLSGGGGGGSVSGGVTPGTTGSLVDRLLPHQSSASVQQIRALTWGKKNLVKIPVDRFVVVRKGKTTERTKRNSCPASRILSLVTDDPQHPSLDIEAPTRLDRDKFARAFARFLRIPLEGDLITHPPSQHPTMSGGGTAGGSIDMRSVRSDLTHHSSLKVANGSLPDIGMATTNSHTTNNSGSRKQAPLPVVHTSSGPETRANGIIGSRPPSSSARAASFRNIKLKKAVGEPAAAVQPSSSSFQNLPGHDSDPAFDVPDPQISSLPSSSNNDTSMGFPYGGESNNNQDPFLSSYAGGHEEAKEKSLEIPVAAAPATAGVQVDTKDGDNASVVSSITGGGFDQDLVEELHLALEKMRRELEESRAEAARAVKVAEQAIQSAENSNSKDWNSTVTHKAAEAAAAAQKKSAEAMVKARVAEEKLEVERKNALMWKKQVEAAEEQAGHWQTRAASAEVQRYAVAEALESERKRNSRLTAAGSSVVRKEEKQDAFDPFDPFGSSPDPSMPSPEEEMDRLRSKLAMESARRRKLLGELQDLRGAVRVYCRPRSTTKKPTVALASNEVLMLHREGSFFTPNMDSTGVSGSGTLSFEFDGILSSDMDQQEVYAEFESVCASVVEGFKICVMAYGASNSGKTHTMLGDVAYNKKQVAFIENHGIQLRALKQLFSVLEHRRDRYQDVVTLTLIEVHDERLIDLLAGTDYGDAHGRVEGSRKSSSRRRVDSEDGNLSQQANSISSSRTKLEIKTNRDGDTVVHGVLSVDVSSFDDILQVWTESLSRRSKRLAEQDIDARAYELGSHTITTLKVVSRSIGSGVTTTGRIQFVDFASADTVSRQSKKGGASTSPNSANNDKQDTWKYANKSLSTVNEVVRARSQYQRSVPYRNSTITHLISDSLEADTKVVMVACVNPEESDLQNTTCTLRFAQEMRKVIVGKATRHTTVPTTTTQ